MRVKLFLIVGLGALLLSATPSLAQPPGGGGFGGGQGGRGGGMPGGGFDPTAFFDRLSGGKDVINRADLDPAMQGMFDRMAQRMGNTSGRITRQEYLASMEQRQNGGPGMGGPGSRGGPGGRGGGGWNPDAMMEAMFRRADLNGDGLLNNDEMPETLRAERDKWDTNRDGFIDLNEFKAFFQARMQQSMQDRAAAGDLPGLDGSWGDLDESTAKPVTEDRRP